MSVLSRRKITLNELATIVKEVRGGKDLGRNNAFIIYEDKHWILSIHINFFGVVRFSVDKFNKGKWEEASWIKLIQDRVEADFEIPKKIQDRVWQTITFLSKKHILY